MGVNYEVNWFWNSGAKPQNNNLFKSFKNFIYATRGCVRGERSSSYICFLCACAILRWISEKCPSFQINDIMGVAVCTSHESRRAIWYNPSQHSKAVFSQKRFCQGNVTPCPSLHHVIIQFKVQTIIFVTHERMFWSWPDSDTDGKYDLLTALCPPYNHWRKCPQCVAM